MDLSKLDKSESAAARVFLRRRRTVYEHFYSLQDLKVGDWISTKSNPAKEIIHIREGVDAHPYDIVIICKNKHYVFGIEMAIAGITEKFIKSSGKQGMKDSMVSEVKINPNAKILYGIK